MTRPAPSLPLPDAAALEHSARVVAALREEIADGGGFITFARYMEIVLYAPSLGYYVAGARKFGAAGDFVTGPELTPLYGAALAHQLHATLQATGTQRIVELGAGSGALAASILNALARCGGPSPSGSFVYSILEVSPDLRQRQGDTIVNLAPGEAAAVEWLDRLPQEIEGAVVMNEVLDAVAPRVVARRGGAWYERGVAWKGEALVWDERPLADPRLLALARARFPAEGDYVSEINPAAEALVATLARRLRSGAMMVVDYGFPRAEYYHPQRSEGTLIGHYRHHSHADPFLWPGLSDLTAHVDFTAVAEAAEGAGLRVAGFATQASFLLGCGILDLLAATGAPESVAYLRETAAVQKLISPAEMGEMFKVLLLSRGDPAWRSLAVTDMTHRL
ncbi:MAG TPA: SAM-dependent methyltransferase [Casimicrobiaceae bacterium]|nr:SAM-dependent methyltransferase [Casimicrobiaceae bacterium]